MTTSSVTSHEAVPPTQTEIEIKRLKGELKEKGLDADWLVMLGTDSNELIIGQAMSGYHVLGESLIYDTKPVRITHPKRFMRLTHATPTSIQVNLFIFDFDVIDSGGEIEVRPSYGYWLNKQPPEAQGKLINLLLNHFKQKVMARAAQAGIITR